MATPRSNPPHSSASSEIQNNAQTGARKKGGKEIQRRQSEDTLGTVNKTAQKEHKQNPVKTPQATPGKSGQIPNASVKTTKCKQLSVKNPDNKQCANQGAKDRKVQNKQTAQSSQRQSEKDRTKSHEKRPGQDEKKQSQCRRKKQQQTECKEKLECLVLPKATETTKYRSKCDQSKQNQVNETRYNQRKQIEEKKEKESTCEVKHQVKEKKEKKKTCSKQIQENKDLLETTGDKSDHPAEVKSAKIKEDEIDSSHPKYVRNKDKESEDSHMMDGNSKDNSIKCFCGTIFDSHDTLKRHYAMKLASYKFTPCLVCSKSLGTREQLERHMNASSSCSSLSISANMSMPEILKTYLDNYHKNYAAIGKEERNKAFQTSSTIISDLIHSINSHDGGDIYSSKIEKAGSHSTQTKIAKADEFDFDMPLKLTIDKIRTTGKVDYAYPETQEKIDLNNSKELMDLPPNNGSDIPDGYAVVQVNDDHKHARLLHKADVIPRKVKKDFYMKVKGAIRTSSKWKDLSLARGAHGPAINLTIKRETVVNIAVDVSPTIPSTSISVKDYNWPRQETKKVLLPKVIDYVVSVGIHLVPKDDKFWKVSFSKAGKALLNKMDSRGECRKQCHMMLKADFAKWLKSSPGAYPGISTNLFKHQLFWMNETNSQPGYWLNSNVGDCYTDMLKDLKDRLKRGKLPNYFNHKENLLHNKDREVFRNLERDIERRREELLHINFEEILKANIKFAP